MRSKDFKNDSGKKKEVKAEKLKWEEEKRREFLTTDYTDYTDCEERRGGGVDEAFFLGFG